VFTDACTGSHCLSKVYAAHTDFQSVTHLKMLALILIMFVIINSSETAIVIAPRDDHSDDNKIFSKASSQLSVFVIKFHDTVSAGRTTLRWILGK
jgi:hypothetical protein